MKELGIFSALYGLDRKDHFEVAIISLDWRVLVVNGRLLSVVFKKQLKGGNELTQVKIPHDVAGSHHVW